MTHWLFVCGQAKGAAQPWCFGHISFISVKAPALSSPARVLPCPAGQCPFPGWPGLGIPAGSLIPGGFGLPTAAGSGSRRSRLCLDGDATGGGDGSGAPGSQRRLVPAAPNSRSAARLGTSFYYRLLTSAGSATNYFGGTRACPWEQAPRSEAWGQLLGEPGMGDAGRLCCSLGQAGSN